MKAKIDADTCIGCGVCANICPELYQMKDDKAEVILDSVPMAQQETAKQAADECPVNAISFL